MRLSVSLIGTEEHGNWGFQRRVVSEFKISRVGQLCGVSSRYSLGIWHCSGTEGDNHCSDMVKELGGSTIFIMAPEVIPGSGGY